MNKLTKRIIIGLLLVLATIFLFHFDVMDNKLPNAVDSYKIGIPILLGRCILIACMVIFIPDTTYEFRKIINLKYRLIKTESRYEVHYLTLNILCIPTWNPIKEEMTQYKMQNMFGAEYTEYYFHETRFTSEDDALSAINDHKKECEMNRNKWLEVKKSPNTTVKYL